jgi:hypothetical protein
MTQEIETTTQETKRKPVPRLTTQELQASLKLTKLQTLLNHEQRKLEDYKEYFTRNEADECFEYSKENRLRLQVKIEQYTKSITELNAKISEIRPKKIIDLRKIFNNNQRTRYQRRESTQNYSPRVELLIQYFTPATANLFATFLGTSEFGINTRTLNAILGDSTYLEFLTLHSTDPKQVSDRIAGLIQGNYTSYYFFQSENKAEMKKKKTEHIKMFSELGFSKEEISSSILEIINEIYKIYADIEQKKSDLIALGHTAKFNSTGHIIRKSGLLEKLSAAILLIIENRKQENN